MNLTLPAGGKSFHHHPCRRPRTTQSARSVGTGKRRRKKTPHAECQKVLA